MGASLAINAIWLHPSFAGVPTGLLATAGGEIYRTEDGGKSWNIVASGLASILCLASTKMHINAGLNDDGLVVSDDTGQTWTADCRLAARTLTRLAVDGHGRLYALALHEGAWRKESAAVPWERLAALDDRLPLLAFAVSPDPTVRLLLAATAGELLCSVDDGHTWHVTRQGDNVVVICCSGGGRGWAGTWSGGTLATIDAGQSWTRLHVSQSNAPVVALAHCADEMLAAATFALISKLITVWRSNDGGVTWQHWLQVAAEPPLARRVSVGNGCAGTLFAMDRHCWHFGAGGWRLVLVADGPILRLSRAPDGAMSWHSHQQKCCAPPMNG